ncbi:MAG: GNAT family N-acetyltransferase [Halobacteriota archaeon]
MKISQILQTCKDNPLKFAIHLLEKIGIRIFLFYVISEGPFKEPRPVPGVETRLLEREELKHLPEVPKEEELERRLHNGDKCFAAIMNNKIMGSTWVDTKMCNFDNLFRLEEGEAYLYNAYTHPEARKMGIAAYLRYKCYKELQKEGFRRFFSITEKQNIPAIRFKEKLGAKIIGSGLRITILGKIDFIRCEYAGIKGEIKLSHNHISCR